MGSHEDEKKNSSSEEAAMVEKAASAAIAGKNDSVVGQNLSTLLEAML